jgi:plasmid maintenance system antidote protein VapI
MAEDDEYRPAEAFRVGEYIRDELNARGWGYGGLAERTGLSHARIGDIIKGRRSMLVKEAEAIARAFGTSPDVWLSLQLTWNKYHKQGEKQ